MELNAASAPYSPDIVYGQLTYPFKPVNIKINAHTPFDEEGDASITSPGSFVPKKNAKLKYENFINNSDDYTFGISTGYKPQNEIIQKFEIAEFPLKSISSFNVSTISNKDIVNSALNKGYSYEQAIAVSKAQKAYSTSIVITKDPIGSLGSRSYQVN